MSIAVTSVLWKSMFGFICSVYTLGMLFRLSTWENLELKEFWIIGIIHLFQNKTIECLQVGRVVAL